MIDNISKYLDKDKSIKLTSTITEVIYQNLKESILKRRLDPNQRIKIREISRFLGVSQTPVREAIQRLAAEKFLVITARSEVKVIDIGLEESRNLSELIQILDSCCLAKNLEKFTEKEIIELKNLTEKLGEYYHGRKIKQYITQNYEIHKFIWKSYGNEVIYQTLAQAAEKLQLVESSYQSYFTDINYLNKSWEEHCALIAAVEARDKAEAEKILARHWIYE
jgi:DNA-binding GntR family transcriptional regulator